MNGSGWRNVAFAISVPGIISSLYLSYHAAVKGSSLICPTSGGFDCNAVTSSPYSTLFGVSVAYLGLAWFVAMVAMFALRRKDIILPLWSLGIAFVAYLVSAELFLIHSICVYCTVAHASAVLLGVPVLMLPAEET